MTIRIAAIEVSHWHALHDAAYLRHLVAMPDVDLVAVQDSNPNLVARRAAEVGNPATFTDYRQMLATVRPDFAAAPACRSTSSLPWHAAATSRTAIRRDIPSIPSRPS
jgi:hypothetical protein